jgi:hypothetical protein
MALVWSEHRALARIEQRLCASDPGLAAMLAVFNRISRCEPGPAAERLSPWRPGLNRIVGGVAIVLVAALLVFGVILLGGAARPLPSAGALALLVLPGFVPRADCRKPWTRAASGGGRNRLAW